MGRKNYRAKLKAKVALAVIKKKKEKPTKTQRLKKELEKVYGKAGAAKDFCRMC